MTTIIWQAEPYLQLSKFNSFVNLVVGDIVFDKQENTYKVVRRNFHLTNNCLEIQVKRETK